VGGPASGPFHGAERQRTGTTRGDRPRGESPRITRIGAYLGFFASCLLASCLFALAACHDPAKEAAERETRDHARLASLVAADEALDRALKAADDASRAGNDAKGAEILEGPATQAADEAVTACTQATVETPWGTARRDGLLAVVRERRASIPSYAQAMKGDALDAKLAAITLQIDLQKQAIEAATAALAPAGGDAG
jgi:hypothetical protein